MDVGPSEPATGQAMVIEELQRLVVTGSHGARQASQESEGRPPLRQRAAGQLSDDRGMAEHAPGIEKTGERRQVTAKVCDPNRGVD